MTKRTMLTTLLGVLAMTVFLAAVWKSWTRKYIVTWQIPFRARTPRSSKRIRGNVCIIRRTGEREEAFACNDIYLFPNVYSAVGVDEERVIRWQDENGFASGGVDSTGALLAPGYPIFSRLAWTIVDPVYLQGDELSELIEEAGRILQSSNDPIVRENLEKLLSLAEKAHADAAVIRVA